ncbi:MAG: hypothetical protein U9Q74_16075 [Gemmatimonadota bacterium]|nr:hypothetical protein [Gemmatimonadota bacterium]
MTRRALPESGILSAPSGASSGWVEHGNSYAGADSAIGYAHSTLIVPSNPSYYYGAAGQVYYTFIGIEPSDGSNILQPVLQWGNNNAFGGNYWSLAGWSCGSLCYYSTPATAYAGDTLAMEIFGSSQSWFCSQTPNPQNCWGISVTNVTRSTGSGLNAADTRLYRWFAAAVEMYDLSDCHQYPGDPLTYRSISAWSYYAPGSSYTSIPILMASMTFSWGVWTNGGLSLQCSYSAAAAGDSVRLWHHP